MLLCTVGFFISRGRLMKPVSHSDRNVEKTIVVLSFLHQYCQQRHAEEFRVLLRMHQPFLRFCCLWHDQNFQKEILFSCGGYKFEITMGVTFSSKVLSTTHSPAVLTMIWCGSKEVWALESPAMSAGGQGWDHPVLVFTLPVFLLLKAPPWQFSELLWTQQRFRNLAAILDNEEAKKCLNFLKHSKCLKMELVLIWR